MPKISCTIRFTKIISLSRELSLFSSPVCQRDFADLRLYKYPDKKLSYCKWYNIHTYLMNLALYSEVISNKRVIKTGRQAFQDFEFCIRDKFTHCDEK